MSPWGYFKPRKAREAKGGIKAQSKRGRFGESWWAQRWIEVLEGFDLGARLGRGRTYARKGQVLSIDVDKGAVESKVQGSDPRPYRISIKLDPISKKDWDRLIDLLSQQAIYAAKLLAGEMPNDIENVFKDAGLSLFPTRYRDLHTDCSCPDWSNPCKHIAAVYYILGEEFDRDPFLLFRLRGMTRDELLSRLGQVAEVAEAGTGEPVEEALPPEPLSTDLSAFWHGSEIPAVTSDVERGTPTHAALLKRLGNFPFWRGSDRFVDIMEPIYQQAAERALDVIANSEESRPDDAVELPEPSSRSGRKRRS